MTTYGLTTTGFVTKTVEVIVEELREGFRQIFGLAPKGIVAKLIGIFAEREALLWELAEAIYKSQDPDAAIGQALDAICALVGVFRKPATKSTVTLTLTGTPATTVDLGSRAKVPETTSIFETIADAEIVALTAWVTITLYAVNDRVTNDGKAYICITAGTSGATGPVLGADDVGNEDETDGTAHWRYMGDGTGAVDAAAQAITTGPLVAESGDCTEIDTPVGGWDGVINLLDANVGTDIETHEALRARRDTEVAAPGTSPIPAIRAALLELDGVTSVTVFYNNTDTTDADGIPPHSVEALVRGGDDQDIWDALFANVAGGIGTHGGEVGTFTDSEGTDHTLKFSRPTEIPIYVIMDVLVDDDEFPDGGEDLIETAIVEWGDVQKSGKNAVAWGVAKNADAVVGVLDVTACYIGIAPAPASSATIAIALRELATYDTSRITINVTTGTP